LNVEYNLLIDTQAMWNAEIIVQALTFSRWANFMNEMIEFRETDAVAN